MAIETVDEIGAKERIRTAVEACYEIEAQAVRLLEHAREIEDLLLRGTALRLRDLASVAMSALDDDHDPIGDIRYRLTGLHEEDESHG